MDINAFGWNSYFKEHFDNLDDKNLVPARITLQHRNRYNIVTQFGEMTAELSGKFQFGIISMADMPTVGDWVAVIVLVDEQKAIIQNLLPRKGYFSRKAVLAGGPKYGDGRTDQQGLAANIDTVFLVSGLDNNYNLRRIERYVTIAYDSGAVPVIILNKTDLCEDIDSVMTEVSGIACGVPVHAVSAILSDTMEVLKQYIKPGTTIAFLGSSGVGKSTLINSLIGEERLKTGAVREEDNRGRHTTTHRELIILPQGGLVIDTPGLREIQLWGNEQGLSKTFSDVEEVIAACRFADCSHNGEPGCAVIAALEDGSLDSKRYQNYLKLQREVRHLELRKNNKERRKSERDWDKKIAQHHKQVKELRKKGLL